MSVPLKSFYSAMTLEEFPIFGFMLFKLSLNFDSWNPITNLPCKHTTVFQNEPCFPFVWIFTEIFWLVVITLKITRALTVVSKIPVILEELDKRDRKLNWTYLWPCYMAQWFGMRGYFLLWSRQHQIPRGLGEEWICQLKRLKGSNLVESKEIKWWESDVEELLLETYPSLYNQSNTWVTTCGCKDISGPSVLPLLCDDFGDDYTWV